MLCVTTNCDQEARKGHFHCMTHEAKPVEPGQAGKARAYQVHQAALLILKNWMSSRMSQETLITMLVQDDAEATYDEVARVLRQAVDSGDLISFENRDVVFYSLPPAGQCPMKGCTNTVREGNTLCDLPDHPAPTDAQVEPPFQTANQATDKQVLQWAKDYLATTRKASFGEICASVGERQNEIWMPVMRTSADVLRILTEAAGRGELEATWVKGKVGICYKLKLPEPKAEAMVLDALDLDSKVEHVIDEMLRTGLYGVTYHDFVREAICAHVREYLKGKK
jgi:hypothetical protein